MPKSKLLILSVFICGAVVMIFELVGSRIMAPYFGSSIFVWTGIIGVILGSLSYGYYLGGKLADRAASYEAYSRVMLLAAAAILWTLVAKNGAPALFQSPLLPIELGSFLAAAALFAPASIILGIVSPYAVRLVIVDVNKSGSAVGNLYAASTVGSIVGTFAAGYFLIPFFGSSNILAFLAAALVGLSFFFSKNRAAAKIGLFLALGAASLLVARAGQVAEGREGKITIETRYNSISIFPGVHSQTSKPVLNLSFDPFARQSSMFLESDELVWDYTKFYRLADHFVPGAKRSLMIGGGAYSYPKDHLRRLPEAGIEVVEIDPGITDAAKKYFRLPDDPRLTIRHEDARAFLNRAKGKYQVIFDDAFTSALTVPFQLATKEAVERQYAILEDGGVVIANIGGSLEGDNGRFLRAEVTTFKAVFPQVYVFPVAYPKDAGRLQNVMLVAIKSDKIPSLTSENPELNEYLSHRWTEPLPQDMPILTDDYAPVEYYMKSLI